MLKNKTSSVVVYFAQQELHLLASGACYWPQQKILIVADLHLEKGSYFALRGQPIPLTDTRNTLEKLHIELLNLKPERIICLGDNVHDASGFLRMNEEDLSMLHSLHSLVKDWCWIIGNHDTAKLIKPPLENVHYISELKINNLCLSHDYKKEQAFQIIGHYHPKISITKQGTRITGKCFSMSDNTLIMPAFGSYTGGLDIKNKIYCDILSGKKQYYLLFQNHIFFVKK